MNPRSNRGVEEELIGVDGGEVRGADYRAAGRCSGTGRASLRCRAVAWRGEAECTVLALGALGGRRSGGSVQKVTAQ